METNVILQGDCLSKLKELPDESINMVVTSPPYWALRDYGVDGQLGLESTFQEYINKLCDIFDECKRVLRKDGSVYINIGDCYAGNMGKKSGWTDNKLGFEKEEAIDNGVCLTNKTKIKHELPQKSLVQIPHRFAIEMANRGWILRNTIIWYKPNCMPSSANDRFTIDFEYVFFFTKNKNYYFEQQYEPLKTSTFNRCNYPYTHNKADKSTMAGLSKYGYRPEEHPGRNMRTVWQITTKSFKEAHFAVYPPELIETPIKASCPEFICKKCGKSRTKIYNKIGYPDPEDNTDDQGRLKASGEVATDTGRRKELSGLKHAEFKLEHPDILLGYSDCGCNAGFESGVVLDPFMGSGTTALVSLKLNRRFLGIELNPKYIEIAEARIKPYLSQTKLPNLSVEESVKHE